MEVYRFSIDETLAAALGGEITSFGSEAIASRLSLTAKVDK